MKKFLSILKNIYLSSKTNILTYTSFIERNYLIIETTLNSFIEIIGLHYWFIGILKFYFVLFLKPWLNFTKKKPQLYRIVQILIFDYNRETDFLLDKYKLLIVRLCLFSSYIILFHYIAVNFWLLQLINFIVFIVDNIVRKILNIGYEKGDRFGFSFILFICYMPYIFVLFLFVIFFNKNILIDVENFFTQAEDIEFFKKYNISEKDIRKFFLWVRIVIFLIASILFFKSALFGYCYYILEGNTKEYFPLI